MEDAEIIQESKTLTNLALELRSIKQWMVVSYLLPEEVESKVKVEQAKGVPEQPVTGIRSVNLKVIKETFVYAQDAGVDKNGNPIQHRVEANMPPKFHYQQGEDVIELDNSLIIALIPCTFHKS